ncbi:uncharacterized protein LOC141649905 [Silene latifolia]|uniref:uncharacterized protein LOC141649905 n=1 Tax=Silene latifolia TaxID=37657 RepID=UPI003D784CF2
MAKPILDSLRVLVNHTDSINSIAWNILSNGGLKQFAALLLIAREKVIAPFDTGLTIHQYITNEINLVPEDKASLDQVEYKCILRDAQTLLALFELAGDDLSSYCCSMQKYVSADDVVDDICGLLIKHKVRLIMEDIDLMDSPPKGYVGRAIPDSKDYNPSEDICYMEAKLEPRPALPQTSAYSRFYDFAYGWPLYQAISLPIPSCLQGRLYSTRACQVGKMSMSLPRLFVSPMPRRLGYIAMKYMGRFRFL